MFYLLHLVSKSEFLNGRQIHEVIGITQEDIHIIKVRKRYHFIIKIDLSKVYYKYNWSHHKLMMLHGHGFSSDFVN
jgi:hypothetical protein